MTAETAAELLPAVHLVTVADEPHATIHRAPVEAPMPVCGHTSHGVPLEPVATIATATEHTLRAALATLAVAGVPGCRLCRRCFRGALNAHQGTIPAHTRECFTTKKG